MAALWVPVSRHRSACGIETADAQGFWYSGNSRPKRVVRQARPERAERSEKAEKVKDKAFQPQPVHLIVISIPKQRISVYGGGGFHAQSVGVERDARASRRRSACSA